MKPFVPLVPLVLLAFAPARAQDRDFLTPNEIDQVREAQEPNERLQLYLHFARQRIDLVQHYLAKPKPGRTIFIHNTLEDYTKIIEAIDSVSDDALRRKVPLDKGLPAVVNAEKEFGDVLAKLQATEEPDAERYKFALQDAIDTTTTSRELSLEDTHARSTELATDDAKQKKEREAAMTTTEVKERKKEQGKTEGQQRKLPSLMKPGEKKPDEQ